MFTKGPFHFLSSDLTFPSVFSLLATPVYRVPTERAAHKYRGKPVHDWSALRPTVRFSRRGEVVTSRCFVIFCKHFVIFPLGETLRFLHLASHAFVTTLPPAAVHDVRLPGLQVNWHHAVWIGFPRNLGSDHNTKPPILHSHSRVSLNHSTRAVDKSGNVTQLKCHGWAGPLMWRAGCRRTGRELLESQPQPCPAAWLPSQGIIAQKTKAQNNPLPLPCKRYFTASARWRCCYLRCWCVNFHALGVSLWLCLCCSGESRFSMLTTLFVNVLMRLQRNKISVSMTGSLSLGISD